MKSICFPKSPLGVIAFCTRISFGVSLLLVGLIHYMTLDGFKGMSSDGLGALEPLGNLWAYILPGLMIVGGALVALGMFMEVSAWLVGIALGSIPVGMLLKPVLSAVTLGEMMPMAINAFIWMLVAFLVIKTVECGDSGSEK